MVTPAFNEEKFIGKMIESIVAQSIPPSKWIIVNDGSTDRTGEIIEGYRSKYPLIEQLMLPKRDKRLPGGEAAIEYALKQIDLKDYDFLARYDADIVFSDDYVQRVLDEFHRDATLGIAGGELSWDANGTLIPERSPRYHVRGALKMYRVPCFLDIGGLKPYMAWDTIDEVSAWVKGWKTKTVDGAKAVHLRPTGSAIPARSLFWESGKMEYWSWSHPAFVLAKTANLAVRTLSPVRAASYLGAFLSCYFLRVERIQDKDFKRVRRQQQIRRMLALDINGQREKI
ncbi:MAG: glycosyltransferase family A protein [Terriglobia bacterium]|jgi:glycosyltransferase involved in cell wall biosynthesis